jgi:tetratricopeptide (TPR) repeat protein
VKEPPGELLAELAPAPLAEPADLPAHDPRRAIPALTKWLIARSHAARYDDPREMLHWGLMAHLAAGSCSTWAAGGRARLSDLQARAFGQFGTSLRVCGRFSEAVEMLATAEECLHAGTGDLSLWAHFCEQLASLRVNQKRLAEARELIEEAEDIHETLGEDQGLANTLVQKAITYQYEGRPEKVLPLLDRALAFLNPVEEPDLVLVARLNRANAQVSVDRPERALASFRAAWKADRHRSRPILRLRCRWMEGKLLSESGYPEEAELELLSARVGFLERNLAPEVVAVSRELADLYLRTGKRRELKRTVSETRAIFAGVPAEAEVLRSLQDLEGLAAN